VPARKRPKNEFSDRPVIRTYYRYATNEIKLPEPILTEGQLNDTIAERRDRRFEQMKRDAIKGLGEVPMILLLFIVSIAAGAFSSLYIGHMIDVSIETGRQLPPLLFMGRTFLVGFFSSCIAITAFLLCLIILMAYNKAVEINYEDKLKEKKQ
jgi:hypothetical protein